MFFSLCFSIFTYFINQFNVFQRKKINGVKKFANEGFFMSY